MANFDFQPFIGKSSTPVRNEVEKGAIRKFAEAIGDGNPRYLSQNVDDVVEAPPTFSRSFDYGTILGLQLPKDGLIHGEQKFEYARPIVAGDVLYASTTLLDVKERSGRLGRMVFLFFEHKAVDGAGNIVVRETSTVIYREGESA